MPKLSEDLGYNWSLTSFTPRVLVPNLVVGDPGICHTNSFRECATTHLALCFQVTLVSHQQEDDAVWLDVASSFLQPVVDVLEGAAVGDVKQKEPTHRVAVVGPGDGPVEK